MKMNIYVITEIKEDVLRTSIGRLNIGEEYDIQEYQKSEDDKDEENKKKQEDYSFQRITSFSSL